MGKAIDLTGQKFGRLIVIKRDLTPRADKRAFWVCQCECGNIKSIPGVNLRKGVTKSCGCLAKELSSNRNRKSLIGQTFGFLTVTSDSGKRASDGSIIWNCKCNNCGDITEVKTSHLLAGDIKSCRVCSNLKLDIIGQKYGLLTPIKYDKEQKKYLCQCNCGNTTYVSCDALTSGKTKSCGCLKSFGEYQIIQLLQENHIQYEYQKTFESCRFIDTNRLAYFDFYIPQENYIIEFDGEQHFKQGTGIYNNSVKFLKIQQHDIFKNEWCKEHNISLIRIPYWHLHDLTIKDLQIKTSQYVIKEKE